MNLNNIRLTPQLLTDLYGNVLIETEPKGEDLIPALGRNEKQILIVVANESDVVLPQREVVFLTSILAACKLTLADVAIVNWNRLEQKDYKALLHHFESRFIFLFDVAHLLFGLPMDFPPFQIQAFDSRQYLFAPALPQIEGDKALKAALWQALKKLFML